MSLEELSEAHGAEAPLSHSLWESLTEGVKRNAEGQAIVSLWQPADHLSSFISRNAASTVKSNLKSDHLSWTYTELENAAEQLAAALYSSGVRKGSKIAAFLYNSVEWPLFFWASVRLGACFCPLNPHSLDRLQELQHFLQVLHADVIVVQYWDLSTRIEKIASHLVSSIPLKIVSDSVPNKHREGWRELSTLQSSQALPRDSFVSSGHDPALVIFTSGTTGAPKACAHTATSLDSATHSYPLFLEQSHRYLLNARPSHIAAFLAFLPWRAGAAAIIPSREFDLTVTLRALNSQSITHLQATPSMISALLRHPLFETHRPQGLISLMLAGESVSSDLLDKCKEQLKAKKTTSNWGMSEMIGVAICGPEGSIPFHDGTISVGKVLPGARVRICEPRTRIPVKRGELGELHCGGTSLIPGYLGDEAHESFYNDVYGHWFVSGDQASMKDDGSIVIHGRYKDIIIRGGVNISPVTVEACLDSQAGVKSQVIGIADPVMGEAPVAIVKTLLALDQVSNLKAALRDLVVAKLGTSFALAGVYTLADLGIDDFPILASGKVHKKDLKARVMEHLSQLQLEKSQASRAYPMLSQVKDVWAQLLGRLPENVESSMSATEVADSLTIMRFCYDVEKQTGKRLSITEVLENPTVDLQARLLREKDRNRVGDNVPKARQSSGPPSTKDMVFTNGDSLKVAQTARCAHSPLKALHLTWHEDVEDAYQNTDAMRSHWSNRQRPASFNIRWAMRVKRANVARVRWALEQALSRHATLRSIIIYLEDGTPIHLVIRPSKQWYDRCIEQGGPVPTAEQVCRLLGRMDLGFGGPPAPLFRGYMMPIESSGEIGLILSINHPAYDAFSLGMFFEDLDLLLQDDTPVLEDRVPFKLFADTYYLHQGGAAARASIDLQVKRLKGISKLSQALWPVAQGPEWLHGNDTGWTRQDGRPGHPGSRLSFDKEENRPEGRSIWRKDTIPSLAKLKGDRSIEASTLVKAAIALYNTEVTGHPHAIFCNLEAGRAWPFLESWIADSLPNPMKIAGPTLVCSINAIAVEDAAECVGALLSRMQRDQARLSEHAHAPFSVVKRELGELDGAVMDDVGRRQVYNWDPSRSARRHRHHDTTTTTTTTSARTSTFNNKGPISSSLELLGRQGWPDYGFFWNFGLEDEETLVGFVMYDDAHLRHAEAKAALDRVVAIVAWMAEPGNWTAGIGRLGELK